MDTSIFWVGVGLFCLFLAGISFAEGEGTHAFFSIVLFSLLVSKASE